MTSDPLGKKEGTGLRILQQKARGVDATQRWRGGISWRNRDCIRLTDCWAERSREPPLEVELLSNKGANRLVVLFPLVAVHFLQSGCESRINSCEGQPTCAFLLQGVPVPRRPPYACINVGARFEVRFCRTGGEISRSAWHPFSDKANGERQTHQRAC